MPSRRHNIVTTISILLTAFELPYFLSFFGIHFKCQKCIVLEGAHAASEVTNSYLFPLLDHRPYYRQTGDINIGLMVSLSENSLYPNLCQGKPLPIAWNIVLSTDYALELVNDKLDILPQHTLGVIMVDNCLNWGVAISSSLIFLPDPCENSKDEHCKTDPCAGSSNHYDVIGIVGTSNTLTTIPLASLGSLAHLPIVGFGATSDVLSDKKRFPNFFRVIPPDQYQVEAILEFISDQKWNYVSVLYEVGHYGEGAFRHIKKAAPTYGICIAVAIEIKSNPNFDHIAESLISHKDARVIIVFSFPIHDLFDALTKRKYNNYFIWIGSDLWTSGMYKIWGNLMKNMNGAFVIETATKLDSNYIDFMEKNYNAKDPINRITKQYCSSVINACLIRQKLNNPLAPRLIDSILTFAYGADALIQSECPNISKKKVSECFKGKDFYSYIKNISFHGISTHQRVQFDKNQDVLGPFEVSQVQYNRRTKTSSNRLIGQYDPQQQRIAYYTSSISWDHLRSALLKNGSPWSNCSRPCKPNQHKVRKEITCCWYCYSCHDNEIADKDNQTICNACPQFQWPDHRTNYTTCTLIPVTHTRITDKRAIVFVSLICIMIPLTMYITVLYIYLRNELNIRKTGRSMCVIQLMALFLGYITVILIQIKPTDFICKTSFFTFCLTCSMLYCPLLARMLRFCLIHTYATSTETIIRFVTPGYQLFITSLLITIQVCMHIMYIYINIFSHVMSICLYRVIL